MKKFLCLFSALTLLLTSCSSDDSNNSENSVLPKTISYTYSEFPADNELATLVYNGNKLVSASYSATDKEVYTYTGDLITKVEDFAAEGNISSKNEFTYENGKLKVDLLTEIGTVTYISKNVYTYNSDGTIAFVTYSVDPATKVEKKSSEGVLTYLNGNLIKKTEIYTGGSYTKTYEYDTKNNPFKNILGYNLLIDFDAVSINNEIKSTTVYNNGVDITTNVFNSVYEYNEKGYPVKRTQSDSSDNDEITNYTY